MINNNKSIVKKVFSTIWLFTALFASVGLIGLKTGDTALRRIVGESQTAPLADREPNRLVSSYNVYLPGNQVGYALVAKEGSHTTNINSGGSFTFIFTVLASHSMSTPLIRVNGAQIGLDLSGTHYRSYEYTISNITNHKTITVENLVINTYTVYLPTVPVGYTITKDGEASDGFLVHHGDDLTLTYALLEGYENADLEITVDHVEVTLDENSQFTVSNIMSDVTIRVSNATIKNYSITLPSSQSQIGYTINAKEGSDLTVDYNGSFTFIFTLLEGYTESFFSIFVNDVEVYADENGEHTITDIQENITITVEDVVINSYTITWYVEGAYSTSTVNHGSTPSYDGTPQKEATETHIFVFSRWSPEIVPAVEDAIYEALFDAKSIKIGTSDPDESAGEVEAELIVPSGVILDAILKVRIVQSVSASLIAPQNKEIYQFYNAVLLDSENNDISDTIIGEITLKFAVPEGLSDRSGVQIIVEEADEAIEASIDGEYVSFTTSNLGDFAIVVDSVSGPNIGLIVGLSVGGFALALGIVFFIIILLRRKKDDDDDDSTKKNKKR
ncbi:MAG: hypothetical protein WC282_00485 [Bacilli bacterium]|jgi:hypothetical protein